MKRLLIATTISILSFISTAQKYWQQEVNFSIDIRLDDVNHFLHGFEEMEYVNNSPDKLSQLYIHVWPNAYQSKNSALAKQLYKSNETELFFGKDEIKGYMDSLDFKSNGQKLTWEYEKYNNDIIIITLPNVLDSGDRINITTPFRVKIPSGEISRLGHIGQSYQITQWFPKPAVYDREGWHHMPYLNQGEFYSEYGSFDVRITLPANYVVGATGDLQTASELDFLNDRFAETRKKIENGDFKNKKPNENNDFPVSSPDFKTLRYTQSNVHDFAWFADKRYDVLKGEVELPHSKRKVTTWAMFTPKNGPLWQKSIEYINDGTYYYSLWNGDYPYNQVTAVDGTISAGGGMEYPNVTVIGNTSSAYELEVVIVHEVGHNWFYGILGTNERVHGWMDEGMNTLNEVRYVQTKYPRNTAMSDMVLGGKFHFDHLNHHDLSDISYRTIAVLGEDQPIETHSANFTPANYGIVMYQKTGLVFFYLKDYLGEELFDKCMREYYRRWEFKHPQPSDMQSVFEEVSRKNLNWLFDDLINTTNHIDYKIKKVKISENGTMVTVKNVGQINGPYSVHSIRDEVVVETVWVEPGSKKTALTLLARNPDQVVIDYRKNIPELNRQNNSWKTNGLLKKVETPKIEFLLGDNELNKTNIFWTPVVAGNYYDNFMFGVAIHNMGIPWNKFNYLVVPMYSTGRQYLSGVSEMSYNWQPEKGFKLSRIGLSIKSFKNDTIYRNNESHYIALSPYWFAKIGNRGDASPITQNIRVQSIYRKDKYGPTHIEQSGAFVEYNLNYTLPDHKINLKLRNEYITNVNSNDEMARIQFSSTYNFRYMKNKMKRWIELRLYGGTIYIDDFDKTNNLSPYGLSLSGASGAQDLFLEEYYFGRNNTSGLWYQQRDENMGGFKSASFYGTTSSWLTTGNIYLQLPIKPGIIGAFADFGAFHNGVAINTAINTGIGLRLNNVLGVYFPLWMSKELNDSFGNAKYGEKIRFTLKFNLVNKPFELSKMM